MTKAPERSLGTEAEVAEYLGVTPNYLARQRMEPGGIPFSKIGRWVRYDWADVLAWVEEQKRTSTVA